MRTRTLPRCFFYESQGRSLNEIKNNLAQKRETFFFKPGCFPVFMYNDFIIGVWSMKYLYYRYMILTSLCSGPSKDHNVKLPTNLRWSPIAAVAGDGVHDLFLACQASGTHIACHNSKLREEGSGKGRCGLHPIRRIKKTHGENHFSLVLVVSSA